MPTEAALRRCKIVSHRGEHDNVRVMENTLPAFDRARAAGVWGIECDIRWTRDLVPVICHDPSAQRVFGHPARIGSLSFGELRAELPLIPSLAEVIEEFGGRTHLMLELKEEPFPDPGRQRGALEQALQNLSPGRHYHVLGLDPTLFDLVNFLPSRHCIAVAEENVDALFRICLDTGYALSGHFLLLNRRIQHQLGQAGQPIGTGFVASRNCLFRELNRGVEWVFSNHAVRLQRIRNRHLGSR